MKRFLGKSKVKAWSAVKSSPEGLFAVTVSAPATGGEGKPCVLACATLPDAEVGTPSLTALSQRLGNQAAHWIFTLDRDDYQILVLPEPAATPEELEQTIRWSISEQIAYPPDQASLAWMRIPDFERQPNRQQKLYVMVSPRALVDDYARQFRESRLPLEVIDVHETAQRNIANLYAASGEGVALLRIGAHGIEFTISHEGELHFHRWIQDELGQGGLEPDAERRAMERLMLQIQRSLDYVDRNLPFIGLSRVLLAPLPRPMAMEEFLRSNLMLPVEKLDLADCFDLSLTPELLQEGSQAQFFTALGSCLRYLK